MAARAAGVDDTGMTATTHEPSVAPAPVRLASRVPRESEAYTIGQDHRRFRLPNLTRAEWCELYGYSPAAQWAHSYFTRGYEGRA